ncbi:MAG: hypothetical protein LAO21_23195 [Acidobacteriia bacterium]|nr:hypothetical protein [Terriglobia bacterium]
MKTLKYKLRLKGLKTPDGTIAVKALKEISDLLLVCSERGLRLAIGGDSVKRGRLPAWLSDSLDLTVTGLEEGSTVLNIEAPFLGYTAKDQIRQQDLWYTTPSPEDTVLTLMSKSVRDATTENVNSDTYDAGILNGLLSFDPFLKDYAEGIELRCRRRPREQFELGPKELDKIHRLRIRTPEPIALVLSGLFNTIEHSRKRFQLVLSNDERIPGTIDPHFLDEEKMRQFWGKKVTVKGTVHFRPSRKVRLVEAEVIKPMEAGEEMFEKVSATGSVRELFESYPLKQEARSFLTEIWGKWPGEESIEELLAALKRPDPAGRG